MGRPLNKKWFGRLADADDTRFAPLNDTFYNITVNVQVGANAESEEGFILRQRSPSKFIVNDKKTGTNVTPGDTEAGNSQGNVGVCTLVDKASGALAANEMSIQGTLGDGTGTQVRIKKLYNRTCRDFANNRYTWVIENDSTETVLRLTAI
jgi:hypothetical protein